MRTRRRWIMRAGLGLLATMTLAGCLLPYGPPVPLTDSGSGLTYNFPDPAGVFTGFPGVDQLYSTSGTGVNGQKLNIPTEALVPGYYLSDPSDALTMVPAGDIGGGFWAPTVTWIQPLGQQGYWVMWVSVVQSGRTNCLQAFQSMSGPAGQFMPVGIPWCVLSPMVGDLDPSIFVSTDGSLWLASSYQTLQSGVILDSSIQAGRLTASGLGFQIGPPLLMLVDWSQLYSNPQVWSSDVNGTPYGVGVPPPNGLLAVENPQLAIDPSPTVYGTPPTTYRIDVFVSYGQWNQLQPPSYHTLEFACINLTASSTTANCVPTEGADLSASLGGGNAPYNPGGMSLMDPGPGPYMSTPFVLFAGQVSLNNTMYRPAYWENSSAFYRNCTPTC
jgi:hypothetical protein